MIFKKYQRFQSYFKYLVEYKDQSVIIWVINYLSLNFKVDSMPKTRYK